MRLSGSNQAVIAGPRIAASLLRTYSLIVASSASEKGSSLIGISSIERLAAALAAVALAAVALAASTSALHRRTMAGYKRVRACMSVRREPVGKASGVWAFTQQQVGGVRHLAALSQKTPALPNLSDCRVKAICSYFGNVFSVRAPCPVFVQPVQCQGTTLSRFNASGPVIGHRFEFQDTLSRLEAPSSSSGNHAQPEDSLVSSNLSEL